MKIHWKILLGMALGILAGVVLQLTTTAISTAEAEFRINAEGELEVASAEPGGAAEKAGLRVGDVIRAVTLPSGEAAPTAAGLPQFQQWLADQSHGQRLNFQLADERRAYVLLALDPGSSRMAWLVPLRMGKELFMRLLGMLIVPIILTSIVTGVASISGGREFGRLGAKTMGYYLTTSLLAACLGLFIVNLTSPGVGANLGLPIPDSFESGGGRSFLDIVERMVPPNVFEALSDNGNMLQVIIFSLFFGFFLGRAPEPHRERLLGVFQSAFEVMMGIAGFVLGLLPYGVFILMARVITETGFAVFKPLLFYMAVVATALILHAFVVLPSLLFFVGRINPFAWMRAMSTALVTAFSTSSSSITLPVTMETVEKKGGVSNKVTSFTLPLGATINMDGTALYECVGVIFLSQFYASAAGFDLTMADQIFVVLTALLASIGAAGIPSAGLVMMLAILQGLGLPVEGAALLLAIDRPLDMMRTAVNIWSDSCGAALIGKSEGDPILSVSPVHTSVDSNSSS